MAGPRSVTRTDRHGEEKDSDEGVEKGFFQGFHVGYLKTSMGLSPATTLHSTGMHAAPVANCAGVTLQPR